MGTRPSKNMLGLVPPEAKDFTTPQKSAAYIADLIRAILKDRSLIINIINEYQQSGGWPLPFEFKLHYHDCGGTSGCIYDWDATQYPYAAPTYTRTYKETQNHSPAAAIAEPYSMVLTASDLDKHHVISFARIVDITIPQAEKEGQMIAVNIPWHSDRSGLDCWLTGASGVTIHTAKGKIVNNGHGINDGSMDHFGTYTSGQPTSSMVLYGPSAYSWCQSSLVLVSRSRTEWEVRDIPAEHVIYYPV